MMDAADLDARLTLLEAQAGLAEARLAHLIADRWAAMIVLGALRYAVAASGQIRDDDLRRAADHLFAALKRRNEAVCWEYARKGGTEGFT